MNVITYAAIAVAVLAIQAIAFVVVYRAGKRAGAENLNREIAAHIAAWPERAAASTRQELSTAAGSLRSATEEINALMRPIHANNVAVLQPKN